MGSSRPGSNPALDVSTVMRNEDVRSIPGTKNLVTPADTPGTAAVSFRIQQSTKSLTQLKDRLSKLIAVRHHHKHHHQGCLESGPGHPEPSRHSV